MGPADPVHDRGGVQADAAGLGRPRSQDPVQVHDHRRTEFFHTVGEGTLAWRDEHIVPLYNQAGVEKFAFLTTPAMPGTVEKGAQPVPDGPATFPTGWFETKERMYAWLTT